MPENCDKQWYCLVAGKQEGPLGPDQVRALIHAGQVAGDTLVWCEGMAGWLPASQTELGAYCAAQPAAAAPPPPAGPPALPPQVAPGPGCEVRLGQCLSESWQLIKKYPAAFLLGNLVFLIINGFAMGLLVGNWQAGMMLMVHKARAGEPVSFGDIFKGFDRFGPVFGAGLLFSAALCIGALFCVIPMFIVGAYLMYLMPLVAVRGCSIGEAISLSGQVVKGHFWNHVLFFFLLSLIASSGVILCYVGLIVTLPFMPMCIAIAYEGSFGEQAVA
ncbi:MAG: GYF domain-containing protein [Pseudomonadota bacterium]